jgi:putative ABC transport system permease protein
MMMLALIDHALGALFGPLNSMHSAVAARSVEIATLRAIGFGSSAVAIAVLIEALLLAFVGAVAGAAIAAFNGTTITTSAAPPEERAH